jgi:hypothetical protein
VLLITFIAEHQRLKLNFVYMSAAHLEDHFMNALRTLAELHSDARYLLVDILDKVKVDRFRFLFKRIYEQL